jgi:pimeloyl-ACP methyl ester carboxylesterase
VFPPDGIGGAGWFPAAECSTQEADQQLHFLFCTMTVYFISGLGVDRRVFQRLQLPPAFTIKHLDWIPPVDGEDLRGYALRLAAGIDTSAPYAIAGLSFGGMIATEMGKALHPEKVILISSASTADEIPRLYRLGGRLSLHRLLPLHLIKQPNPLAYWFLGISTEEEKTLLRELLKDASTVFIEWAIDAILHWNNKTIPDRLVHIHGSADRLLPYTPAKNTVVVKGGGHFAVYAQAAEVSALLVQALTNHEEVE